MQEKRVAGSGQLERQGRQEKLRCGLGLGLQLLPEKSIKLKQAVGSGLETDSSRPSPRAYKASKGAVRMGPGGTQNLAGVNKSRGGSSKGQEHSAGLGSQGGRISREDSKGTFQSQKNKSLCSW